MHLIQGNFFPTKHFQNYFFFFTTKTCFQKYMSYPGRFFKINPSLKSTVSHNENENFCNFFLVAPLCQMTVNQHSTSIKKIHSLAPLCKPLHSKRCIFIGVSQNVSNIWQFQVWSLTGNILSAAYFLFFFLFYFRRQMQVTLRFSASKPELQQQNLEN